MAVLGDEPDALLPARPHRQVGDVLAGEHDLPRGERDRAEQGAEQLGLPVALHPGDADDLAPADAERHVIERRAPTLDHRQTLGLELDDVGDRGFAGLRRRQVGADHQLGQFVGGDRRWVGDLGHGLAGADHGDRIGDGEHLVELVGDEDHGGALGGEAAQAVEELVDLLGHEYGGGLVEDEDPGPAVEDLEDLDPLALADAELLDELVRVDVEAVAIGQLLDLSPGRAEADHHAGRRLAPEDDVLEDGEVVGEHEVLVDHADAEVDRLLRRAEVHRLAEDLDRALVRCLHAVEDLHQRRLAGPVLADDGMDRPGLHREVDPVVGDHAGEALDDAAQADRHVAGGDARRGGATAPVRGRGGPGRLHRGSSSRTGRFARTTAPREPRSRRRRSAA